MQLVVLQRRGKVPADEFSSALSESLASLTSGLSCSAMLVGFSDGGWAKVNLDGVDAEIVGELVAGKFSRALVNLAQLEVGGNHMAIVDEVGTDLEVDLGVEQPEPSNAKVGVKSLRAQLCDGKGLPCREIAEYYGISVGSALTVRIERWGPETRRIEAWLSDSQIELFSDWMASGLERVQVFNCTRRRLESAIQRANLERDVISVEDNTLTTHSVVCKLGTEAVGLIPKLGTILRKSELKPFIPKRILTKCRPW